MKKRLYLFILLMLIFIPNTNAYSKELFRFDENVEIKNETIDGTSFVFGNNVNVQSEVNGILFEFGNNTINKSKQDYLFLFGNTVSLDNSSLKDGFIFGNKVELKNSNIQRDLYLFGNTVDIDNSIGRDLKVFASQVNINGDVNGDLFIEAENITIGDSASVSGTLSYPKTAKIFISKDAKIANTRITEGVNPEVKEESFLSKIYSTFISCLNMIVTGIVFMLMFKKLFSNMTLKKENVFQNLGIGLITLLLVPIASVILLTTIVGLSLSVILLVVYFIFIYLSTLITAYYVSDGLLKDKIKNKYLILVIGVVVIYVLKLIPVIGTIITLGSLLYGLGFVTNSLIRKK